MARNLKSILIIIPILFALNVEAQTASEWFSQKSTQKQYLLQQIAALQAYSKYLRSGYGIAKGGLGSITGSLRSEYGLHDTYYTRLKTVAPPVKNNELIKNILNRQTDILKKVQELNGTSGLTSEEKSHLISVGAAVLKDCDQQLQTLANITQDGKMEMSDADRLSLLGKVDTAMIENYRFIKGFTAKAKLYAARKQQEQQQVNTTKHIYGLN